MILTAASALYGAVASWRRRWYAGHPDRRRTLHHPVVSIGNLTVGGSGKTPLVVCLARLLAGAGERPAILTRGYARQAPSSGVTMVSDCERVLCGIEQAGDEPLMMARALPGVPVLVGADRYASGRVAEDRFASTVHLLDDGFQHFGLARDADLLVVNGDELTDRVLPAGRLREPVAAAASADALLVPAAGLDVDAVRRTLGVHDAFTFSRSLGEPVLVRGDAAFDRTSSVFAAAGIAKPERFFADLQAAEWSVAGTMAFPDHHPFTIEDMQRIVTAASAAGARVVVTTEKDAVRMEAYLQSQQPVVPFAAVPLTVTVEPSFLPWLLARLKKPR